jgi:hypothetical protein
MQAPELAVKLSVRQVCVLLTTQMARSAPPPPDTQTD